MTRWLPFEPASKDQADDESPRHGVDPVGGPPPEPIEAALNEYRTSTDKLMVLTGMAEGADAIARTWARRHGITLLAEPLVTGSYPGPMHRYNERMLSWQPDVVLAFKDDLDLEGRPDAGTEHMCLIAIEADIPVHFTPGGHRG